MRTADIARPWPKIKREIARVNACFAREEPRAILRTQG